MGGGAGTNAIAFCQVYPELTATVFDLPATLPLAEKTVKDAGFESRIAMLGGDFNLDELGGPYDVALMSDILHYQTFETNQALVKKVYEHLAPGGRLVIKDRFLDEAGTGPAWTTAFAVHILVNTQQGACYKTAEAMRWMTKAGFVSVSEVERTAVVQGMRHSEVTEHGLVKESRIFWDTRHDRGRYQSAHGDLLHRPVRDRLDSGTEASIGCSPLADAGRHGGHARGSSSVTICSGNWACWPLKGKEGFGGSQALYHNVFILS